MPEDLLVGLRKLVPTLRPSEARVASAILNDPIESCRMTIKELADSCETSVATVMRLSKKAGYDGFRGFRQALTMSAASDRSRRIDFGVSNGDINLFDPAVDIYRKMAFEEAQTVEDTITMMDFDVVERVIGLLDAAPSIDVYGQASSGLAAQDLQQKLSRIGYQINSWCDSQLAVMSAARLPPKSVAVGFSHSGRTDETIRALGTAREYGAATVAVTNYADSPITRQADMTITTVSKETRFRYAAMPSRMAQLIVVDVLFMGVARLHPDRTRDLLARTFSAVGKE